MQALNRTRNKKLVEKGTVANRPWLRLRGLLGRSALEPQEGLLLLGTKSIHTIGMRFAIDVLFLDVDRQVVHLIHTFKPFRVSPFIGTSAMVLELPAGILKETETSVGDWIELTTAEGTPSKTDHIWTETEKAE